MLSTLKWEEEKQKEMWQPALSSVAQTVGKFAMDACLYMSQNFGFLTLPGELTTGSSIMPHKKKSGCF